MMRRAIEQNDTNALLKAIKNSRNLNAPQFYVEALNTTLAPIHLAAYLGHDEILKLLIINNADIDHKPRFPKVPWKNYLIYVLFHYGRGKENLLPYT